MKQTKKSFTLSELLLAVAILGLVFSSILLVFVSSLILNESSRNLTVALTHAKYVMEDIKNSNFGTIEDNGDTQWDWDSSAISDEGLSSLKNETIDVQVSGTDVLDVMVVVNWEEFKSRSRSINLETLIAKP